MCFLQPHWAAMGVQQWCIVGVTVLLLVCEVAVSQLCHSLILLVDSFHTFYILMHSLHLALTHRRCRPAPPRPLPDSSAPPPPQDLRSLEPPAILQAELLTELAPPPPLIGCGLSYSSCRTKVVGSFLAALFLASLCVSGVLKIIALFLAPKPVQHHLLLVAVSGSSLLLKTLVLWWRWEWERTLEGTSSLHIAQHGKFKSVCVCVILMKRYCNWSHSNANVFVKCFSTAHIPRLSLFVVLFETEQIVKYG